MPLHDGDVECIARRDSLDAQNDVARAQHVAILDWKHLVDDSQECVQRWLYRIAAIDRDIPVKDLLEYLRIRHQALTRSDSTLEEALRIDLVRVLGADQVHWNIRVDQDHDPIP